MVFVVVIEFMNDMRVKAVFDDIFKARRYVANEYKKMGEFPFELSILRFEINK